MLSQYRKAGWTGTRGWQSGGQGGADLAGTMPDAVEVKYAERVTLWPWVEQAQQAATGDEWALWIRSNRRPWVVTVSASRYLELLKGANS